MWKKATSIMLIMTLVCLSLAGCKSSKGEEGTGEPTKAAEATKTPADGGTAENTLEDIIPKETVTLTVYSQLANYNGEQLGWFAKLMLDKFNVKLNIVDSPEGVFATRMESGELGDLIFFGNDTDEYQQAIAADMLLDWNEDDILADYGPYINENMQNALNKNAGLSPDGTTVHGFGFNVGTSTKEHQAFIYHPDIRWDLYAKLGYPKVEKLEDYVDILADMVELEPKSDSGAQTYGVSFFKDWDGDMVMYVKATGALYGFDEFGFTLYNVETQEVQPILDEGSMYLRSLKFYNALYQKGLLDPDSMTQTSEDAINAYQDGAAFFNIFTFLGRDFYNTEEHTSGGKGMYALAADDMNVLTYGLNIFGGNRIWAIGANTEYPELCMAIINYMCTPEGTMSYFYGPKGVTWDYNESGKAYLTELGLKCQRDKTTELTGEYSGAFEDGQVKWNNESWDKDSINPEGNGETYNCLFWESYKEQPTTEAEQAWKDYTKYLTAEDYLAGNDRMAISLGSGFTMDTKDDDLNTMWAQVAECVKSYTWQMIYAKTDAEYDSLLTEFRAKAKEYGYDTCVEWCIGQAEKRKAKEDALLALE
jgi:multiple sugar transport system substrate-binding protein/putative aldouronate transport system substrate-binding protein